MAKKKVKQLHPVLLVFIDLLLIGALLCTYAFFHHVLPRKYAYVPPTEGELDGYITIPSIDSGEAPSVFTEGEVIKTQNSYKSPNVSVTMTCVQKNGITYYVQDIYVRYISLFKTAFAQDTYGLGYNEDQVQMAKNNNAICSVNGDYYGLGDGGAVIRNGTLYRGKADADVCLLNYDGTVEMIERKKFDAEKEMAEGAYQAWCFGPVLLDEDGKAISEFNYKIVGPNPRTGLGYYEPGHYCFVTVDGRQPGYSNGITLADFAVLFEEMGCKAAYNMDGGQTAMMTFDGKLVNRPASGGRQTSDIIYICDFFSEDKK